MPSVADYIKKKYGYGDELGDQALAQAQQKMLEDQSANRVFGAGEGLINTLGGSNINTNTPDYVKSLNQSAQQPVDNILQRRQALDSEATLGNKLEGSDPDSQRSEAVRQIAQKLYGDKISPEMIQGLSAQDADTLFKPADFFQKADEKKADRAAKSQERSDKLASEQKDRDLKKELEGMKLAKEKEPNKDQFTVANFGKRMQQSEDIFKGLEESGYDRSASSERLAGMLPGEFKSVNRQKQDQAEKNFVNAVLRRESGAAISPSEFESARQQYFPQPGDAPEVRAQKEANRQQAIGAFHAEAGNAWDRIPLVSSSQPASSRGLDPNKALEELKRRGIK